MKKLLLVCCIALGVSTLCKAQGGGGFQRRTPEQQTAALKTSLNLTADQEGKVLTIYKAQAASNDSMGKAMQAGGDPQAMMQKMTAVRNSYNARIKATLTPEQAATFQKTLDAQAERMKQMMQQGGGGMGGGGGTPPPPIR